MPTPSAKPRLRPTRSMNHSRAQKGDGGGELEGGGHVAVIAIVPVKLGLERRLEQRDDLPIDIVQHDRHERQSDDQPSPPLDPAPA